jgi:hypothetical protein
VVIAAAIGATALLGLSSALTLAIQLGHGADDSNVARRAADQALARLVAMDDATFRAALAAGPSATALAFDAAPLAPAPHFARVGAIVVSPAPGTADFDQATLFQLTADCRWTGAGGAGSLRLSALAHPVAGGGP